MSTNLFTKIMLFYITMFDIIIIFRKNTIGNKNIRGISCPFMDIQKKSAEFLRRIFFCCYQDLESQASASVVSSAAGASSVAASSAFSAASAAAASALLFANSAIRASLTLASASNLSF